MTHDQLACLICVSVLITFLLVSFYIIGSWQKKHRLFVVLYHDLNYTPDLCEHICKTRSEVSAFVNSYCSLENVSLVGVYTFVPDAFLKEFGGSILSENKNHRR